MRLIEITDLMDNVSPRPRRGAAMRSQCCFKPDRSWASDALLRRQRMDESANASSAPKPNNAWWALC
jgi:hypothetical protein